jgi:heme/copper-type cytochrome/quinol oxidase subunit 3
VATLADTLSVEHERRDHLSGTPRGGTIDRWIYVFTVASFIAIVFAGFIPDSLAKMAAVDSGLRPPFPAIVHVHAVLMGTFLLLLLAQTSLVAAGRNELHQRLGIAAFLIAPAIVLAGFILIPTMYGSMWHAAQAASPQAQPKLQQMVRMLDNIMLMQLRIGVLFPLFLTLGLRARARSAGFHKRMIILATAMTLPAAIDRIMWLPTTFPSSPLGTDLYTLLAVSPMFVWDVLRNRMVHPAYLIWLAINLPFALAVHGLWDTAWWHSVAPRLMGL